MATSSRTVVSRPGEPPIGAPPPDVPLGARPPELILKSLNTGLTSLHISVENAFAYTFTRALKADLEEIFKDQHAHSLFLCEMGSQKDSESIDMAFKRRRDAMAKNNKATPTNEEEFAIVDNSSDLKQYLEGILQASGLEHLQVRSLPPYACIWDPQWLSVSPPECFVPLDTNKERFGVKYEAQYRPTDAQFSVVCNHSPSSRNWDNLTVTKKKTIFEKCLIAAGARHGPGHVGASPPMWVLCGDLNTSLGSMLTWKKEFEYSGDAIGIHKAFHDRSNKAGDYMLSQGFSTTHVESNIGCSEKSRKHASDSHDMVTLMGHPAQLKCGTAAPSFVPSLLRHLQAKASSRSAPSASSASSYAQVCRDASPLTLGGAPYSGCHLFPRHSQCFATSAIAMGC